MNFRLLLPAAAVLLSVVLYFILTTLLENPPAVVNDSGGLSCSLDSDCGVSGYTGSYFCRDSSIFGEYVTRLCLAGNSGFKCVNIASVEYVDACVEPEECIPGLSECRRKATTTEPTRPPAVQEYVIRSPATTTTLSGVVCVRNSSCGFDHYGKPYCAVSGHAVRDYVTYVCLNPGTHASKCMRERKTYLVDYCGVGEACIRGECVDKNRLDWYCIREDCCATDFSLCEGYPVRFLPFPIRGLQNETYYLWHNTTVYS